MKKVYSPILLTIFCFSTVWSQTKNISEEIKSYLKIPQEVVYLHLNKSTYIKGEDVGFTAYLLDKKEQKSSEISKNLFVTIEDNNKKIISQKLLKVENGVSYNTISLDSTFTSGFYKIKAFTNWMRNFDEQNYFVEEIRVIDTDKEEYIESELIENALDVQFMPESGHLLDEVNSNVGVLIKNSKGYGVPNLEVEILDKNNKIITSTKVNKFGIGRFSVVPERDNSYSAKINYLNEDYIFRINHNIEKTGAIINCIQREDKLFANIKINSLSKSLFHNKPLKLILNNNDGVITFDNILFKDGLTVTKGFSFTDLPPGVNMLTLFNENNIPIAERLFFNYKGLAKGIYEVKTEKIGDSLNIKFKIEEQSFKKNNNISASILPLQTSSYKRNNNIISYNLIQPYINGFIEQPGYYFNKVDVKKKYELDNLLITQGWSSYDWNNLKSSENLFLYAPENGISLTANINSDTKRTLGYMFQTTNKKDPLIIKVENDKKDFTINNIFINEAESIYFTELIKNSSLKVPKLYIQSYPNKIPKFNFESPILKPKSNFISNATLKNNDILPSLKNTQKLDEILIVQEREKDRIRAQKLNRSSFGGHIKVISKEDRQMFFALEDYIRVKGGVQVRETRSVSGSNPNSGITFFTGRSISPNSAGLMDIFIDDAYIGQSIAPRFILMNNVDYVEINKVGLGTAQGQGFRGSGGIIRVYTAPNLGGDIKLGKRGKKYDIPLKFAGKRKFYIPKYKYYNDPFFNNYGTIDWKSNLKVDEDGFYNFKIKNFTNSFKIYLEGLINDSQLIYQEVLVD